MKLGPKGEALIKSFEGYKEETYLDERGIPTIAYGHTGWYSPGVPVALGQTCTAQQAQNWFSLDTSYAVNGVIRCLTVAVNQNQFDALVSFAYNLGVGALAHSTLLRYLNQEEWRPAADEFPKWDYAGSQVSAGLQRRRLAERSLFLAPVAAP